VNGAPSFIHSTALLDLCQAAAQAYDLVRHRLRIASELGDDGVAVLLLFPLTLLPELGEVLRSPLGCCRSHRFILAANIELLQAEY
jgi:hypothetical protein